MTDTDNYTAENADTTQPPEQLEDGETAKWNCAKCGKPLEDAMDLAEHDCED